jgi:hypothetical protein
MGSTSIVLLAPIDPGFSLSNHWSGIASSAIGKKSALMSSSPPASLIDWEYILSHYLGLVLPSYLGWLDGLNLWGNRTERSWFVKQGNLSGTLASLYSDLAPPSCQLLIQCK